MSKIGIYSGTFDPVHDGHVAFAEAAIAELKINTLYMLAEETPWRKSGVTDVAHRKAMLDLAIQGHPKFLTALPGMAKQHNVATTMGAITKAHPKDQLVLLMGTDVFLNIDKWPGYKELIEKVEFAVALRTEDDGEELIYKLQEIPDAKVTKIVTDKATISSSQIRKQIAEGRDTIKGLNPKVFEYMTSRL